MKSEIKVPPLGESVTEACVSAILKGSGEAVATDDEIIELETDKVNQVLYAPTDGTLTLSVALDDMVKIGDVIGFVDSNGSAAKQPARKEEKKEKEPEPVLEKQAAPPVKKEQVQKVVPVQGGVRKSKQDFLQDLKTPSPAPAGPAKGAAPQRPLPAPDPIAVLPPKPEERVEKRTRMSKIRQVIAQRLVESQNNAAMLTTFNEVDMTTIIELRKRYQESFVKRHGIKLGFMSFFVKAAVSALQAIPGINSYIDGNEIVEREYYDVGIAVSSARGLVVPVLRNCEVLGFAGIETAIAHFAKKAREGGLSMDELQGGGFTITNGGVFGSLLSTPILNPPQSGILGMHKIQERPVAVQGKVEIRPMMYLALSYDHRIVDGKEAVTFLVHMKEALEYPSRFLLDI